MALVYLGGPIDLVEEGMAREWRQEAKEELLARGVSSYDPASAFAVDIKKGPYLPNGIPSVARLVSGINRQAIDLCDGALFALNGPAFGTLLELEHVRRRGIPVVVIASPQPISLEAWPFTFIRTLADAIPLLCKNLLMGYIDEQHHIRMVPSE